MRQTIKALIFTIIFQIATVSWAVVIDIESDTTSGVNDTVSGAQALGTVANGNPLTAFGWIAVNNQNDVDFYQFSVSGSGAGLFFDIDFADDVAQTDDNDFGLDSALWVFNATGELIAWSDWSDFFGVLPDPDSDPFSDGDAFIGELLLPPGTYYAVVSYFGNEATSLYDPATALNPLSYSGFEISGALADTNFLTADCREPSTGDIGDPADPANRCTGQYQLQIRTSFDNFNEIPEPASFALVGIGLLGMVAYRCRRRDRSPVLLTEG